jgi:hypothetical protein
MMSRLPRLVLYAAMGPVSGPLTANLVVCLRQGRYAMAGIYGAAIVEYFTLLGAAITWLAALLNVRLR